VIVLVGRGEDQATWTESKRDGSVALITAGAAALFEGEEESLVVSEGGAVAAGAGPLAAGDGFAYSLEREWLVRTSVTEGSSEALFSAEEAFAFIAYDGAYFGATQGGVLSYAPLALDSVEPVALEQRGTFDDDDYPATIGLDQDAVYWLAGSDPALRASDGDPLALFRTCRP
jgi:hypothetical protein